MNKKEQWANEVLDSLNGIKKASPDSDLFNKIVAQLPTENSTKIIPLSYLSWVAVAACLIICVNIYVFNATLNTTKQEQELVTTTTVLSDYSIYNSN